MKKYFLAFFAFIALTTSAYAEVRTIVQPPFTVTSESEMLTTWPDQSIVYAQDTGNTWQLKSGQFVLLASKSRGQAIVTRAITTSTTDTGFQVSATKDAIVRYNIELAAPLTLTNGSQGSVVLEICVSSCTLAANWTEISRFTNGNTGTLTVGINTVQTVTGNVGGLVPANNNVRIRSMIVTGSPTFTYRTGQEILL